MKVEPWGKDWRNLKKQGERKKLGWQTIFCFQIFVVLVENYVYKETLIFSHAFIE